MLGLVSSSAPGRPEIPLGTGAGSPLRLLWEGCGPWGRAGEAASAALARGAYPAA